MNPLKVDPSRTGLLQRKFYHALAGRFKLLNTRLYDLVAVEDAFGLKPKRFNYLSLNDRWRYSSDNQKLTLFKMWLKNQMEQAFGQQQEDHWFIEYVEQGYKKGIERAFVEVKGPAMKQRLEFYYGNREQFLRDSFSRPASIERLNFLGGRVFTEIQGITDALSQKITRTLVDGMVGGLSPRAVGRNISEVVSRLGLSRATTLARTETIRAHAEGALDGLELLGVQHIAVAVEWTTAKDGRVCQLCKDLQGIVIPIEKAHGLFPRHPNCRCTPIPANVGEKDPKQVRSKARIREAVRRSVERQGRRGMDWPGSTRRFNNAPEPVT